MGGQLSLHNNGAYAVRAEVYAKTGSLVQKAHIPSGHVWDPSAKLAPMIPYRLITVDGTGLRWCISFNAPTGGKKVELKVSDVEDGEFLAPVQAPVFPSGLDKDVRRMDAGEDEKHTPHPPSDASEPYEVVAAHDFFGSSNNTTQNNDAVDDDVDSDEKAFKASRARNLEDYTKVPLATPRKPLQLEKMAASEMQIELEEPVNNSGSEVLKTDTPPAQSRCSSKRVLPVVIGGVLGAAFAGPVGYWMGQSSMYLYPIAGAVLGGFSGMTADACGLPREPKKTILPE
uniref:Uncharacterized protein n=1 Tax=Lotharella oceanica TaxID=641309 RepID=A0A7S2TL46_9EUKA|mmetsp:Transcript_19244/g.36202  ORF Transcript_19244/g.36202 Transcript_19244/m.36202 type:complete len:286 (+) Transcript_19244:121-978(+)|eukprot:CAMPEP_0170175078 /NCGR_PEP_ID=MMETSP0040_2-20121228/8217_1 /TAXON_ID=641309 /ORGANISM="Lotharella oceanica, Strain CCMP622" /LENGTH=285 /DNA_ID=CAMNT_0010416945 /DNA_START=67 /DNA_END=924 /DNA_ORIENTATION=-